ncbi:hypothetical protein BC833DRAFT_593852 [Globomyces pollinis-pini]|nr:hypothetical protein BC833DRAFT_593852 [Globomyces pollinis-pini]
MKATPCAAEIQALFNCWRSSSIDNIECAAFSSHLALCMSSKVSSPASVSKTSDINLWIKRSHKNKQI